MPGDSTRIQLKPHQRIR